MVLIPLSTLQFSSLEPDVKCRLVFIKDLELVSGDEYEAVQPPAGRAFDH